MHLGVTLALGQRLRTACLQDEGEVAGALPARVQLVLRPGTAAAAVLIAITGLRVHYLRLPHQALQQAPASYYCVLLPCLSKSPAALRTSKEHNKGMQQDAFQHSSRRGILRS